MPIISQTSSIHKLSYLFAAGSASPSDVSTFFSEMPYSGRKSVGSVQRPPDRFTVLHLFNNWRPTGQIRSVSWITVEDEDTYIRALKSSYLISRRYLWQGSMNAPSYLDESTNGNEKYSLTGDNHCDMFELAYHL